MKRARSKTERGAVTVFLTIVLVPCIIFVCAFGDVSRVQLSRARATSAADLAMYSLLANYDEDLKEYYGIVASCQNIDDFYNETAKYFKGMMAASGMDDTGSELLMQYLSGLRSGSITDFLQVEVASDIKVSAAENSVVGSNPALIEDGIVEFMKYRAPVEIVKKMVDRFREMGNSADYQAADDAAKDQKVAEAKTEAARAEGELLENVLYSYIAMRQYEDLLRKEDVPSIDKYNQYSKDVKTIWDDYHGVTELITRYYAGTDGIRMLEFPSFSLNKYKYKAKDVGKKTEGAPGSGYCIDEKTLKKLLKGVDSEVNQYRNARQNIINACSNLPSSVGEQSGVNEVRYSMAVQNAVNSSDLNILDNKGNALMKKYAKLDAALDCEPFPEGDDLPHDWKHQIKEAMKTIRAVDTSSDSSSYKSLVSNYYTCARERHAVSKAQKHWYTFSSRLVGKDVTIEEFNNTVKAKFAQVYNELEEQDKTLFIILNGGPIEYNHTVYHVKSLKKILALAQKYGRKRDKWGSTAHNAHTEYGNKEYDVYSGKTKEDAKTRKSEELADAIDEQSVKDMIQRLTNIRGDIRQLKDSLKEFTYGGIEITRFSGESNIISAGRREIADAQSLYLTENDSAAAGYFPKLIRPTNQSITYPGVKLISGQVGNEPDISKDCKLYQFLDDALSDLKKIESGTKKAKKQMEDFESKGDDAKGLVLEVQEEYLKGRGGTGIGRHSGGSQFSETSVVLGLMDTVKRLATGNFGEIRDRVYVCEYAMDMFSYSTFNNEGEYHMTGDKYKFKDFSGGAYPGSWEPWNRENAADLYENQSLTNAPINKKNNKINLAEVEYILYGDHNANENLKKMYGSIFRIRMAMNLASGFVNFYTGPSETAQAINALAEAIFVATSGIVPVPLTKCVFIGVLATMESAKDLEFLKAGQPVDVYKKDEKRWLYSLAVKAGEESEVSGLPMKDNQPPKTKFSMYYSDYLYLFLYSAVTNNSTYNAVLLRMGDLIEANMKLHKSSFSLMKSKSYFKLSGELRVKPLLLTLPIVDAAEGVDDVRKNKDWCTYKVDTVRGYS